MTWYNFQRTKTCHNCQGDMAWYNFQQTTTWYYCQRTMTCYNCQRTMTWYNCQRTRTISQQKCQINAARCHRFSTWQIHRLDIKRYIEDMPVPGRGVTTLSRFLLGHHLPPLVVLLHDTLQCVPDHDNVTCLRRMSMDCQRNPTKH